MIIVIGNGYDNEFIYQSANTPRKIMNPIIFLSAN